MIIVINGHSFDLDTKKLMMNNSIHINIEHKGATLWQMENNKNKRVSSYDIDIELYNQ